MNKLKQKITALTVGMSIILSVTGCSIKPKTIEYLGTDFTDAVKSHVYLTASFTNRQYFDLSMPESYMNTWEHEYGTKVKRDGIVIEITSTNNFEPTEKETVAYLDSDTYYTKITSIGIPHYVVKRIGEYVIKATVTSNSEDFTNVINAFKNCNELSVLSPLAEKDYAVIESDEVTVDKNKVQLVFSGDDYTSPLNHYDGYENTWLYYANYSTDLKDIDYMTSTWAKTVANEVRTTDISKYSYDETCAMYLMTKADDNTKYAVCYYPNNDQYVTVIFASGERAINDMLYCIAERNNK